MSIPTLLGVNTPQKRMIMLSMARNVMSVMMSENMMASRIGINRII